MISKAIQRLEEIVITIPSKLHSIDSWDVQHQSPGKWSKKQILGHLIDSASNNHQRFIRIQFEDEPTIWYDQNEWVDKSGYSEMDVQLLIDLWTSYNKFLIQIIKNIQPESMNKMCVMKDGSKLTLEYLMIDYVHHLDHHLNQII